MSKSRKLSDKDRSKYFEIIYKDYFNRLFAYALVITKSDILAKDIVSEVFYNLWNSSADLSLIKELKSYLFTSVKNEAIRTISSDPLNFNSDEYKKSVASIDWINPEEILIGKELEQLLDKAIRNLPPHCGLVYKMIKEDRMKYEEVANELGISIDTVKYHLKTAIRSIKAKLENHFDNPKIVQWFSSGSIVLVVTKAIAFSVQFF